jgi:hypothetical protein
MVGDLVAEFRPVESFYEEIDERYNPIFFSGQPCERMRPDWARGHQRINDLCDEMKATGKIVIYQVPFLVGSTIKLFQDIVSRKMAPKPRSQKYNEEELKTLKGRLQKFLQKIPWR